MTTNSLTRRQSTLARSPPASRPRRVASPSAMSKKGAPKTQDTDQSYEVRDVVLAKVRGFPPWPGMVSTFSTFHRVHAWRVRTVFMVERDILYARRLLTRTRSPGLSRRSVRTRRRKRATGIVSAFSLLVTSERPHTLLFDFLMLTSTRCCQQRMDCSQGHLQAAAPRDPGIHL